MATRSTPGSARSGGSGTPPLHTPRATPIRDRAQSVSTLALDRLNSLTKSQPSAQMVCLMFVAGHDDLLEREIAADESGQYEHLRGTPKALLPAAKGHEDTILGRWWREVNSRNQFADVYLITNANKYKHFERWATAVGFPVENIVNDGTTTNAGRLGAATDLDLVLRAKGISGVDVMVLAGDMLFSQGFDISGVQRFFKVCGGDVAIYYDLEADEDATKRGLVDVDAASSRVTALHEKPHPVGVQIASRHASVVFYVLRAATLESLPAFLEATPEAKQRTFGRYLSWLVADKGVDLYGMKLPTAFDLIGQTSLAQYAACTERVARSSEEATSSSPITKRAFARVGLLGNPSDGFFGKTISVSVSNFWAEVSIVASARLRLVPHPLNDPNEFGSLADLHGISRKEGYQGGLILLQATCKRFYEHCSRSGIALAKRNFTLRYTTNVPRQVGLAGSSAIITATLQCLMGFYGLSEAEIPKVLQPSFVLSVEMDELFIQAGLQDRVIQTYEGCMFMDFERSLVEGRGYGEYERIPTSNLPYLWLAYLADPSNSGKIHSDVKARWKSGDERIINGMAKFGKLTDQGRAALLAKDWTELGRLMDANFALRRELYGDACIGDAALAMISVAQSAGVPVKFPGSGGAVVGMCESDEQRRQVRSLYEDQGYVFVALEPHEPSEE